MSITSQNVIKVIEARLAAGNDTTLNDINNAVTQRGLNTADALDISVQVGNILLQQRMKEEDVVTNVISAYKASAYKILTKNGIAFNNDPELHKRLLEFFGKISALIKDATQSSSGVGIGGLTGGGISGASLSVTPSAPSASAAPIEGLGGVSSGGIPVPGSKKVAALSSLGAQSLDAFTGEAPATAAPAQNVNKQQETAKRAAEARINNAPIAQITEVDHLETYAEHELKTPKERISITAKEANDRINEFLTTGNWEDNLGELLAGKSRTVYYKGADIIVRRHNNIRAYLLNDSGDKAAIGRIEGFLANHNSLLGDLDALYGTDDCEHIIKTVTSTINAMKKNIVELYSDLLKDDVGTEAISAEVARFANVMLGMMSVAVHNALSLGTDRCKNIPTNPAITLERTMDDLDFFSGYLYEKTLGENGYSTEPDFFRELFLLVATALRKVTLSYEEGEVLVGLTNVEIVIPGNYPTLKRNNVVGKHSLGATHDPVSVIYELFIRRCPEANVYLKADDTYLLLSTGETTAPIYY